MKRETITLQPGLLVSLKTSLDGGVSYTRVDLDAGADTEGGDGVSRVAKWETTRVVADPVEHKAAASARSSARAIISKVCTPSAFGLICLSSRESELDEAVASAREVVKKFNEESRTCRIGVYVMKGRIAQNDAEAARGISDELRELMDDMEAGIAEVDVKKIRDAAARAKKMGAMLDKTAADKVGAAVSEAREIAKAIVKKATEKGANVAQYVESVQMKAIEGARYAFLDLDVEELEGGGSSGAASRKLDLDVEEVGA